VAATTRDADRETSSFDLPLERRLMEMPFDLPQTVAIMLSTGLISWWATGQVRRFALERNLMDVPNARSSHSQPTPRGGGVAIVASFLLTIAALYWADAVDQGLAAALLGSGTLVAVVGFADDRWGLPARWRFAAHVLAALWVLWWLKPFASVSGYGLTVSSLWILLPSFVVFITWCINLFNFMDGIDGIASIETITVAMGGAVLAVVASIPSGTAAPVALAAAAAGFLVWNWPPARIFMGDAGSGFLGLAVATLALWQTSYSAPLFWSWLILVGCFMVDSTTTLLRRVRRGERFHVAHRSHAYQFASRRLAGHLPVSVACGAITLFWLLPIALAVALRWLDGGWGLLIAYLPLVWLAYRLCAGDSHTQHLREAPHPPPR
jgi:Fuc2NAc and GlcNAc transferase